MAQSGESKNGPAPEGPPRARAAAGRAEPGSAPPPAVPTGAAEAAELALPAEPAWVPTPAQRRIEPLLAALAAEPEPEPAAGFFARLARWFAGCARFGLRRRP